MAEQRVVETVPTVEPQEEGSFFSEHPKLKYGLIFVVLLIIAGVVFVWSYYSVRESTDNAQIEGHIYMVSARLGGTILRINVADNQRVEAGAVLAEIDPRDYDVALERARADLAAAQASREASQAQVPITSTSTSSRLSETQAVVSAAQAEVTGAETQRSAAEARANSARARVRQVQANHQRAARDVERLRPLLEKEEISKQQFDVAEATATALQAEVESAQAQVVEAEEGIRVAASHVDEAKARLLQARAAEQGAGSGSQQVQAARAQSLSAAARVKQAEAALAQNQLNLEYTRILAPVSGVVSRKSVEVGQTVQAGQPLMAVVSLDDIWVTANFKETQLDDIRPGQKAVISVDAYGGRKYNGHVQSIAGATGAKFSLLPPENASGNFVKIVQRVPVKIVFEKGQDPEHVLRPGMSVEPTVFTGETGSSR